MTPRTYLFVPGDRPERFAKALACGADAVVLDLEDAVAPDRKALAREAVGAYLATAQEDVRPRLVVRVNDESSSHHEADLQMLRTSGANALMLPKAERAGSLERLTVACPGVQILALIETARGVLQAEALAAAPGVARLVFGTIDYALDLDLSGAPEGFIYAASRLALASRAAGLPAPVAGVTAEIQDESRLLADLAAARAQGFAAKLCIHPKQVEAVHRLLRPTDAELAWARRVLDAADAAGGSAVQLDGRMVDRPVIERARILIGRDAS